MTPLILASQLVDAVTDFLRTPPPPNIENALFLKAGYVLYSFGFHTTMIRGHKKQPAAVKVFSVFQYFKILTHKCPCPTAFNLDLRHSRAEQHYILRAPRAWLLS